MMSSRANASNQVNSKPIYYQALKMHFVIVVLIAGIVGDFIHIHMGMGVPTYSTFIEIMSYLTKPEEALGFAIIYYFMGDRLPTHSRLLKGVILAIIMLLAEGQLIRQLFMNLLLPNTFKEAFLFQSQIWLSKLAMAIIITLFITPKYSRKQSKNFN